MTRLAWLKAVNAVYWLLLSLWFGGLAMSAVSAAVIFPTMKRLDVLVPEYQAFPELEGAHWMIAAGRAQNAVFFVNDMIQLVCGAGVAAIVGLHMTVFRMSPQRPANVIRALALGVALIAVCYELFVLAPRMQTNLQAFWRLPETGDVEAALAARQRFQLDHPKATMTLMITFASVGVMVLSSAAALTAPPGSTARPGASATGGGLEEPALLRRVH